jgi:hypothetical protein
LANLRPIAAKNYRQQEVHSPPKEHRSSSAPESNAEIEKAIH